LHAHRYQITTASPAPSTSGSLFKPLEGRGVEDGLRKRIKEEINNGAGKRRTSDQFWFESFQNWQSEFLSASGARPKNVNEVMYSTGYVDIKSTQNRYHTVQF
jgi:hypothetical protein